jgi:hypothetical protein
MNLPNRKEKDTKYIKQAPIYPISFQGGGDYRGIYDIGFKRGFMGYIGLLLNAPYKIDSMVWMSLIRISFLLLLLVICKLHGLC